ncbi:hypothetical protein [Roseateles sp. L2-2]|uniref:hypothetical protein n=1 Tax=Roseateles sp. L2-2 TaxID=3422597 RepID=UPI003D36A4C3
MANITKFSDLPNFKHLDAMAQEAARTLSESKELWVAAEAWHQQLQQRYSGKRDSDSSSELLARLVKAKDPFYLSRMFTDI